MAGQMLSQMLIFNAGIADQINKDLVASGNALQLKDCVFSKTGRLVKRGGHTAPTLNGPVTIAGLTDPLSLATRGGAPVLLDGLCRESSVINMLDDATALGGSYSGVGNPVDLGLRSHMKLQARPKRMLVSGDDVDAAIPSCAYLGGLLGVAFKISATTFRYVIQEADTGAVLFNQTFTGTKPKVVANGSYLVVFYVDAGNLDYLTLQITGSTLTSGSTSAGTIAAIGGAELYDVHAYTSNEVAIAYQDSASPTTTIRVRLWSVLGGTASSTAINPVSVTMALAWVGDGVGGTTRRTLVWAGASGVVVAHLGPTLVTLSNYALDAGITANVRNLTGATLSTGNTNIVVLVEISAASLNNYRIDAIVDKTASGGTLSTSTWIRGVGLRSKTFFPVDQNAARKCAVLLSYESEATAAVQQSTYFLGYIDIASTATISTVTINKAPQLTLLPRQGAGHSEVVNQIVQPVAIDAGARKFALVVPRRARIEQEGTTLTTERTIEAVTLDFACAEVGNPKEVGPWLLVPGGQLRAFDGRDYHEWPFDLRPEAPTITSTSTGSGVLTPGDVRAYRVVYSVTDNAGRVHRSAPSTQVSGTVAGGDNALLVTIPTLRLTSYDNAILKIVTIEVYATEANAGAAGLLFQLVKQLDNDLTLDSTAFVDISTNAMQNEGTLLYCGDSSAGSELENLAPPGLLDVTLWKNRIAGISCEKPTELWLSKNLTINTAPGFSESLVVDCPEEMTALAVVDDQLILFSATSVYRLIEEPPDDTGSGTLPRPQKVGDVGTTYPRMVATWDGVWFQSGRRLLRVSRGAQVEFGIADAAEDVVRTKTPCCAVFIPERSQLRWYYTEGDFVIFDTKRNVWSTAALATTIAVKTACNFAGNALLLVNTSATSTPAWKLWRESDSVYTDPNPSGSTTDVIPQIMGPFLSAQSKLGMIRIHEVQPLGERLATHQLRLEHFTNFNRTTAVETVNKTMSADFEAKAKPKYRRCQSYAFRLSERPTVAGAGTAGAEFTGVLIRYSIESNKSHRGNAAAMT